jgi:ketosteroid isomerase-like protein
MTCASFDEVLGRNHEATAAFMRRDTQPFKDLFSRQDDATLANPFGGVARGFSEISPRLDRAATYYSDGEVIGTQTISTHHSDDLGYLLEIEHLRGRVGSRDVVDDVSLRVTSVFRCEDGEWRLVHRHADPASELRAPETIV